MEMLDWKSPKYGLVNHTDSQQYYNSEIEQSSINALYRINDFNNPLPDWYGGDGDSSNRDTRETTSGYYYYLNNITSDNNVPRSTVDEPRSIRTILLLETGSCTPLNLGGAM